MVSVSSSCWCASSWRHAPARASAPQARQRCCSGHGSHRQQTAAIWVAPWRAGGSRSGQLNSSNDRIHALPRYSNISLSCMLGATCSPMRDDVPRALLCAGVAVPGWRGHRRSGSAAQCCGRQPPARACAGRVHAAAVCWRAGRCAGWLCPNCVSKPQVQASNTVDCVHQVK